MVRSSNLWGAGLAIAALAGSASAHIGTGPLYTSPLSICLMKGACSSLDSGHVGVRTETAVILFDLTIR